MKRVVILGAGTAGTIMAAHLVRKLPDKEWKRSIVDEHKSHYYQPGFLHFLDWMLLRRKK